MLRTLVLALLAAACAADPDDARMDAPSDAAPRADAAPDASRRSALRLAAEPAAHAIAAHAIAEPTPVPPHAAEAPRAGLQLADADAAVVVRVDAETMSEPPVGLAGRPWIEVLTDARIVGGFVEVALHGVPAISADGRTLVWMDGDPDFQDEEVVVASARTGRVRQRLALPYRPESAQFRSLVRLLERGDFLTLPQLSLEDGEAGPRFVGEGLVVAPEGARRIEIRDAESLGALGSIRARTMDLSEEDGGGRVTEGPLSVSVAPDRAFALVSTGACGCWCWIGPRYRFVGLQ